MNFGCRPITDDVTKVKIILINNRSEGTFFRISVRFCCSVKASMTSDDWSDRFVGRKFVEYD